MKRLGVFIFFDRDGIVDDYVLYLLSGLQPCWDDLKIVCNGKPKDSEYNKFKKYTSEDNIYIRPNEGMDAGALKDFFTSRISLEELDIYDEIFWFNDTCYGPFFSMKEIFDEMGNRNIDFWGLTAHSKNNTPWISRNFIPEHIQSYFLVLGKRVFTDSCFMDFWTSMDMSNDFKTVVESYELSLTETFSNKGFTYDVYCDTRKLVPNFDNTSNITSDFMCSLVENYHFPFVKRKNLLRSIDDYMVRNNPNSIRRTMNYIKQNTSYPIEYIYKNLIRLYPQNTFGANLCTNYILDSENSDIEGFSTLCTRIKNVQEAVFFENYLKNNKLLGLKIIVVAKTSDIAKFLNAYDNVQIIVSDSESLSDFLKSVKKHIDYDESMCTAIVGNLLGKADEIADYERATWCLDSMIFSEKYIKNINDIFKENSYIGVLYPRSMPLSKYECKRIEAFNDNSEIIKLSRALKLNLPSKTEYAYLGDCFWIRNDFLKKIYEILDEINIDVSYLIYGLSQKNGYLCGTVIEEKQAASLLDVYSHFYYDKDNEIRNIVELKQRAAGSKEIGDTCLTIKTLRHRLFKEFFHAIGKRIPGNKISANDNSDFLGFKHILKLIIQYNK